MTLLGVYVARESAVHRAPAGPKLIALLVVSVAVLTVPGPWAVAGLGVLVVVAALVARLGVLPLWQQVRPLRFAVPLLFALQWWSIGLERAALLSARLVLLVALAGVMTLTTRTSDMLDALTTATRPLGVLGIRPDRVALVLSLTIRSVPVLVALSDDVRAAQKARGRERDLRAYAVPLVVGTLRRADALGEALRARGVDD